MASNFAVVRSRQPPPGGGLIGSKSYNLQRRDEEPIKTVGSDLVNKLCKCGETYPSLIERAQHYTIIIKIASAGTTTNRGRNDNLVGSSSKNLFSGLTVLGIVCLRLLTNFH